MTKVRVLKEFDGRKKGETFKLRYQYAKDLVRKRLVVMVNKDE